MMLRKPSEVDHLEKYYIANYTAAIYYLDRHILEARDQDYLDQLLLKCKKEVLKMQQNLRMNTNPKSGQICTELERRFFNQLHQTLQVLTDGSLRNTLLSHKHKSKALQERLHLVSKYLI